MKKLTKREMILLAALVLVLLVVGYIKIYFEPLSAKVTEVNAQTENEQTEVQTNLVKAAQIQTMEKEIADIKAKGDYKELPAYDNSFALTNELYAILGNVQNYAVTFGKETETDSIMAKTVTLTFECSSYGEARTVIDRISDSQFAVDIGNVSIECNTNTGDGAPIYSTGVILTYYEAIKQ